MEEKKHLKNGSETLRMICVLMVIAVISGGALASVYSLSKEKVEYQEGKKIKEAINAIIPEAVDVKEADKEGIPWLYECRRADGKMEGWAFIAEGPGYQDIIKVLAVTNEDLSKIIGLEVLENSETPGLGAKINAEDFKEQFRQTASFLKLDKELSSKGDKETVVQAITGATISSQAVVDIINNTITRIKESLK